MYLNGSPFRHPPTTKLLISEADVPELWQMSSCKAHSQATIEYGGPYWQLFCTHLTQTDQRRIRKEHPHLTFPPIWPHPTRTAETALNYHECNMREWDYAIASKNIYDELDIDPPTTEGSLQSADTGRHQEQSQDPLEPQEAAHPTLQTHQRSPGRTTKSIQTTLTFNDTRLGS